MRTTISIIICTMADPDRAAMFRDAVQSILKASNGFHPAWELIIVDNSPNGRLETFPKAWPEFVAKGILRWVSEKRPGISMARNAGLASARGDYLCFLDDDVIVSNTWLQGLLSAFTLDSDIGCVAGRIHLQFDHSPLPRWLHSGMYNWYGQFDLGADSCVQSRPVDAYGGNMAFSREAIHKVGGFNPSLGRQGGLLLSGEDTDYVRRVAAAGFKVAYSADGWIRHRIQKNRLNLRWMLRRHYWQGVTESALSDDLDGYRTRTLKNILNGTVRLPWNLVSYTWDPQSSAQNLFKLAWSLGRRRGAVPCSPAKQD
jgi:glucosyl-dolichyl phosphate glucuronosyltransferase